ncbi:MAG TPA: FoF1 ATP synthase subunit gamma [Dongiaceae bacterium]|nr:FoF1 ATP synthase subunit gamma [Dongiaceae bacterium]
MSERLAQVGQRIATVRQLGTVVSAMRGIAAARAQQSRTRLPAMRAYAETVLRAIASARRLEPGPPASAADRPSGKPALIILGAEQGFAGAFPEQVLAAAADEFAHMHVLLVGNRTAALAAERDLEPAWTTALPSGPTMLASAANVVLDALYEYLSDAGAVPVAILYPVWKTGGGVGIIRRDLLPLDPAALSPDGSGQPPLTNLPPADLVARLLQEYVFTQIYEGAIEAFTAENEARAATMAAAKENIDDKLAALEREQRLTRQEEITAEVVELAAGVAFKKRRA